MRGLLVFGLFFAGIASIFLLVGALMAQSQRSTLASAVPVQVKILESELDETMSRSSDGRSRRMFSPSVVFEYTVNGQRYESTDATPLDVSSSDSSNAREIVSKYQSGTTHTGYYDRNNPSAAFLVRQVDFFPYAFVLFPLIHFSIGTAVIGLSLSAWAKPRIDTPVPGRATLKSPVRDPATTVWLFAGGPWALVGAWAFWHYHSTLQLAGAAIEWWVWVVVGVWALFVLLIISGLWRAWTTGLKMGESRLTVTPYPLHDGAPVRVEIERDIRSTIDVRGVELLLVAKDKHNREKFSHARAICGPSDGMTQRTLRGRAEFEMPSDRDSTWTWRFVVRTLLPNNRKHETTIPAEVALMPPGVQQRPDDISGAWPAAQ
jgi:hypothetical protein